MMQGPTSSVKPSLTAIFPNNAIGADPGAIKAFATAVEDMGFAELALFDHVLGASSLHYDRDALSAPLREKDLFNEPMVTFGYLAGVTRNLRFATTVMILSQRQTALVAKQAAQVDVLSGGRLRLGVGTGWNTVEYDALGVGWARRGRRIEEQIRLLRQLWTEPVVDFEGEFHRVKFAGLNPLPIQRPIPIWLGGTSPAVIDRCARIGDGWLPQFSTFEPSSAASLDRANPTAAVASLRRQAAAAGRDAAQIGLECRLVYSGTKDDWHTRLQAFRDLGATIITLSAAVPEVPQNVDAQLAALREMKEELEL